MLQKGNIMVGPEPGAPGQYRPVISNYIKQGDNMTLVVDKTQKELLNLSIATYLDDSRMRSMYRLLLREFLGPNRVSGVSKQLTIAIQNSNYQHL